MRKDAGCNPQRARCYGLFVAPRRAPDEDYLAWLSRATHSAESARDSVGIKSWGVAASLRKCSWAGHVARMNAQGWASRMTAWRDSVWWAEQDHRSSPSVIRPMRARVGHFTRWEAELCKFSSSLDWPHWWNSAAEVSTVEWNTYSERFSQFVMKSVQ